MVARQEADRELPVPVRCRCHTEDREHVDCYEDWKGRRKRQCNDLTLVLQKYC